VEQSFASVLQATIQCMSGAGLSSRDFERVVACLALAGASEPSHLEAARQHAHPYRMAVFVTDAQAAYVGAHGGHDGGIIVIGTGSIGGAELNGRQYRVGGLAGSIEPWLADATRRHLVSPRGDAVAGAVQLARDAAESLHRGLTSPRRSR
jgi:N-acetylglucosamine kinase-like BadF-type ATPase